MKIAKFLQEQKQVEQEFYPGLEEHKAHDIAKAQMKGFGGILSFTLKGGCDEVERFLPKLKLAHLAASLGSVGTLAGPPRTTSHVELNDLQRSELGIPESLIRYSVGIENVEDLISGISQGLKAL